MALDRTLAASMNRVAYRAAPTGTSLYGDPSYGAAQAFSVRTDFARKRVVNALGEEVVSEVQITTQQEVGIRDRVWLPGLDYGNPALAKIPKSVAIAYDPNGQVSHYEVFL